MATSPYILELREHIGHELLLLPGVTAVVVRETEGGPQVLLGRRSDDGRWSLPGGIVEPGEQPAVAVVREIVEETRVVTRADRLIEVSMEEPIVYPNGDRCQFLLHYFRCSYGSPKRCTRCRSSGSGSTSRPVQTVSWSSLGVALLGDPPKRGEGGYRRPGRKAGCLCGPSRVTVVPFVRGAGSRWETDAVAPLCEPRPAVLVCGLESDPPSQPSRPGR